MKKKGRWALLAALAIAASAPAAAEAAPRSAKLTDVRSDAHRARATLHVTTGVAKPWAGQRVPLTVTATFRDVEGVTLEGGPQITSPAIVTSELTPEPKQSTRLVQGVPSLVVTWTGWVTPEAAGPLDLSVTLPVRIRYRDAAPAVVSEDPFSDFGADDDFDSLFDRMRHRMEQQMERAAGAVHEQASTLKATAPTLAARALPVSGRPASFTGAVGTIDVTASASVDHARVSDPITIEYVVSGDADLDRVTLAGVPASEDWKVYPPRVVAGDAAAKGQGKVFEQVVVPLRAGDRTLPPVAVSSFDPARGAYVTHETAPISVAVAEGPATSTAPEATPAPAPPVPNEPIAMASPRTVAFALSPAALAVLLIAVGSAFAKRRVRTSSARAMRAAAASGRTHDFFSAARRFVTESLGAAWGVPGEAVTAASIRERLGDRGEPLAAALTTGETLRFGRGELDPTELRGLSRTIERALRGAT